MMCVEAVVSKYLVKPNSSELVVRLGLLPSERLQLYSEA